MISKLYKKEEETLLNKKKKRDEIKQKNKFEKNKNNIRNTSNQYSNYYQRVYMSQMQPINNQNPPVINEYPYYYWQFPPNMYGFPPPNFHQYIDSPKDLKENINDIYQRGIVNNIIGAFFIQEFKEKKNISEKRKVPISMVELGDDQDINILNKGDKEKIKIFDVFIKGAKEGIEIVLKIFPTLVGLFVAIGALRYSGVLDFIIKIFYPAIKFLGIPKEIMPLALLRPISR